MRFLKLSFSHQTTSPGSLRVSLKQFPFLANFREVMYILKRLPASRTLGVTTEIMKLGNILKHESNEYIQ